MSDTINEFDEGGTPGVADVTLKHLYVLGNEMLQAERIVQQYQDLLASAQERYNQLRMKAVPDAMIGAGLFSLKLDTGQSIEVADYVSGSLPKEPEAKDAAIHWLEENNGESILKTKIQVDFGKSEHNMALHVIALLREAGIEPSVDFGVHAATLQAFAREALRNGDPVDADVLGLFIGRVAKIKEVKAPKPRKMK